MSSAAVMSKSWRLTWHSWSGGTVVSFPSRDSTNRSASRESQDELVKREHIFQMNQRMTRDQSAGGLSSTNVLRDRESLALAA
jgi:hypothetical protein